MARTQHTDEPSMEDLLASIRRAIHEEEGLSAAVPEPRPIPRMPAGPAIVPSVADDISALREKIHQELAPERPRAPQPPAAPPVMPGAHERPRSFTGMFNSPRPVLNPAPSAPARPAVAPRRPDVASPALTSSRAAESAAFAFDRLSKTSASAPQPSTLSRLQAERSFEEITREMLQPMLRQWLDRHLPALVERLVKAEIERIARRGR